MAARIEHLVTSKEDALYVANVIAAWSARYLDKPSDKPSDPTHAEL